MPLEFSSEHPVFKHPGQESMQVQIILASRHADYKDEKPLFTIRMRYPRIIHGEIMTHRVFSRNARSSRAVPVKTMLNEARIDPFVPWHWGKNQKGMQADEECNELVTTCDPFMFTDQVDYMTREKAWLHARDAAVTITNGMMNAGYHKQIPNRLLEPFSWIDTLVTSNDWANFLWLRDHKDAEPHLQDLARLVRAALVWAYANDAIQELGASQWHLPYITEQDIHEASTRALTTKPDEWLRKISAARCARISYKPFDGDASYERELERYDQLVSSDRVHASPTEHQATPDSKTNFRVENQEFDFHAFYEDRWNDPHLHGNLPGWIQARKLIPNERHYD